MKISKLIPIILIAVFVLTACQLFSSGTSPATQVASTEASAAPSPGAYPYPQVGADSAYPSPIPFPYPEPGNTVTTPGAVSAYPSPVTQSPALKTAPVYPDLKDGAEVAWSQVKDIFFSGQVVKISQTHDLNVYITLNDGRTFKTVEPAIDDVLKLVQTCGDLCKDIKVATE
jgi:hypothetical protein